jgi:predicted enzyme related to lactoylglutathione lyase
MSITRTKLQPNVGEYTTHSIWWTDLNTTNEDASKQFYGELLNWTFQETPSSAGNTYTVAIRDGQQVAGMMEQTQEMRSADMPSFWLTYINVEDAAATCARAKELGGTVMREPFAAGEAGTMAIIVDPTGAAFAVWQPASHEGAAAVNGPGALCWLSLMTDDKDAAGAFYGELFGWKTAAPPEAEMDGYLMFLLGERPIGGMGSLPPGMSQAAWGITLGVDDAAWAIDYTKQNGGSIVSGPHETPWGTMVTIQDPTGAVVTLCGMQEQSMQ